MMLQQFDDTDINKTSKNDWSERILMVNNSIRLKHFQPCILMTFRHFVEIDVWAQYAESKFVLFLHFFFFAYYTPVVCLGRKWKKSPTRLFSSTGVRITVLTESPLTKSILQLLTKKSPENEVECTRTHKEPEARCIEISLFKCPSSSRFFFITYQPLYWALCPCVPVCTNIRPNRFTSSYRARMSRL